MTLLLTRQQFFIIVNWNNKEDLLVQLNKKIEAWWNSTTSEKVTERLEIWKQLYWLNWVRVYLGNIRGNSISDSDLWGWKFSSDIIETRYSNLCCVTKRTEKQNKLIFSVNGPTLHSKGRGNWVNPKSWCSFIPAVCVIYF